MIKFISYGDEKNKDISAKGARISPQAKATGNNMLSMKTDIKITFCMGISIAYSKKYHKVRPRELI